MKSTSNVNQKKMEICSHKQNEKESRAIEDDRPFRGGGLVTAMATHNTDKQDETAH